MEYIINKNGNQFVAQKEDIDKLIEDDYFRLIKEQLEMATNGNECLEKGQLKVLKPNNTQK